MTGIRFEHDNYYEYDLREPPRKIIHPDRVNTNKLLATTDDWSNIPFYPTAEKKRERKSIATLNIQLISVTLLVSHPEIFELNFDSVFHEIFVLSKNNVRNISDFHTIDPNKKTEMEISDIMGSNFLYILIPICIKNSKKCTY